MPKASVNGAAPYTSVVQIISKLYVDYEYYGIGGCSGTLTQREDIILTAGHCWQVSKRPPVVSQLSTGRVRGRIGGRVRVAQHAGADRLSRNSGLRYHGSSPQLSGQRALVCNNTLALRVQPTADPGHALCWRNCDANNAESGRGKQRLLRQI